MNLPLVLDIAISLIFVYLILSFLASELQELLTTLLQWRAAHLKKSIEILLGGGSAQGDADGTVEKSKLILKDLYNNPLIQNISQESKDGIEGVLRQVTRSVVTLGRKERLTLKGNEPSYIPSETFATTLLEQIELSKFAQSLTALKLKVLTNRDILAEVDKSLQAYLDERPASPVADALRRDLSYLKTTIASIETALESGKISLQTAVYRLKSEIRNYIRSTATRIQKSEAATSAELTEQDETKWLQRTENSLLLKLISIQHSIFYDDDSAEYNNIEEVIRRLQPTLAEVLEVFKGESPTAREQYGQFLETYQEIQARAQGITEKLPIPIQKSLAALARRAEINLQRTQNQVELIQDELKQFKLEIQNWFDRSMERASGVYKRNAKGVGFLIGLVLAIAINADTFHIVTRLANDSTLREALVSNSDLISRICPPSQTAPPAEAPTSTPVYRADSGDGSKPSNPTATCIADAINQETALPLGWNDENRTQQENEQSLVPLPMPLRRAIGWVITGFAIAMGASFWFDLLAKVVNVRNAGKRPEPKGDAPSPK